MSYLDSGYNEFLENSLTTSQGQSELDFQSLVNDGSIDFSLVGANAIGNINIRDGEISSAKIKELSADKILAGIINAEVEIGVAGVAGAYVKLDGPNNRIVVNDGNTPRIVIGNV